MKRNKSWLIVIGSFLILSGIGLIGYDYYSNKVIDNQEELAIEEFYQEETEEPVEEINEEPKEEKKEEKINYIAVLKIPKIKLVRGLVDRNSYQNNIKYNVQILKDSSMPDEYKGNVILAAHSGNARISYFKNLDKLVIGDDISIEYNSVIYNYKVVDIYLIDKTGTAEIIRNKNKSTLTLITCKHNTNKQTIVIAELT
ncbi:MAG TPA: sortase [Bacilli bacterium]|nr:sortase [Bacilli bacterium]